MQTCIWPSCCRCHSLSLASVKSRSVLPCWYRLTRAVAGKGPLSVCACVRACRPTINGSQSDFGTASIDVEQGLCRASICLCLSRLPTRCCCCGFAAVGPASRCRSVAHGCQPSISRSTAHSSKCGQCHVVSYEAEL